MSRYVHSLKVGDHLDIKGPFEKWNWEKKPVQQVGMVAGKVVKKNRLRSIFIDKVMFI